MKPIATDTHDFPKLREKGCIYVDKTRFIHRLVTDVGTNLFFVSRPRRFGKSLTVSAMFVLGVPDEEVRRDLCTLMAGVAI